MNDLEITRLCAKAVGLNAELDEGGNYYDAEGTSRNYWPLIRDEQAMELVKKIGLSISGPTARDKDRAFYVWCAYEARQDGGHAQSQDLNRAICECVAKLAP